MPSTHEVTNQVPPLVGHDVAAYPALLESLAREGAGWATDEVRALGRRAGSAEAQEWGRLAEKNSPVLHTHDRYGHRVDEVEFDPAWHQLMTVAVEGNRTDEVLKSLRGDPAVCALHTTNGRWDIVAELRTDSLEAVDKVLSRIRQIDGISNTETSLLLSTHKY